MKLSHQDLITRVTRRFRRAMLAITSTPPVDSTGDTPPDAPPSYSTVTHQLAKQVVAVLSPAPAPLVLAERRPLDAVPSRSIPVPIQKTMFDKKFANLNAQAPGVTDWIYDAVIKLKDRVPIDPNSMFHILLMVMYDESRLKPWATLIEKDEDGNPKVGAFALFQHRRINWKDHALNAGHRDILHHSSIYRYFLDKYKNWFGSEFDPNAFLKNFGAVGHLPSLTWASLSQAIGLMSDFAQNFYYNRESQTWAVKKGIKTGAMWKQFKSLTSSDLRDPVLGAYAIITLLNVQGKGCLTSNDPLAHPERFINMSRAFQAASSSGALSQYIMSYRDHPNDEAFGDPITNRFIKLQSSSQPGVISPELTTRSQHLYMPFDGYFGTITADPSTLYVLNPSSRLLLIFSVNGSHPLSQHVTSSRWIPASIGHVIVDDVPVRITSVKEVILPFVVASLPPSIAQCLHHSHDVEVPTRETLIIINRALEGGAYAV